jgi:transposase
MTASKYIDALSQHVIPQLDGQDLRNQLTLHDNAPLHKAQTTIKFLQDNRVDILDWPAFSPDLNPIEKL